MTESKKLRRLREMKEALSAGKLSQAETKALRLSDTDGRVVRLDDGDALEVIGRRIEAEESNGSDA